MKLKTIKYLKIRTAELSIGNSTLRNQGAAGVVKNARNFLAELDLLNFSVNSEYDFYKILDDATSNLVKALPTGARHWGTARKAINIFLRDCVYNKFLCSQFDLAKIHPWLEIPLDSYVAKALCKTSLGSKLPKWVSITRLKPKISIEYQKVATQVAEKIGCYRVDLDIYLWREIGINEIKSV